MQRRLRNFSIIAHIDHGKSTIADRLLELTKTIAQRDMKKQLLDTMDLEQERGITIKLQPARMEYTANDGDEYILNLIDTPGHVDFTYEVSRSLAACEGALLVVDATQGVEAQTIANVYLAIENDLHIIPVMNKIDLPSADVAKVTKEIEEIIGKGEILEVSAKTGVGMEAVLEKLVEEVPEPEGDEKGPLKALIFDSYYDAYQGVIIFVRVMDGKITPGQKVKFMHTGQEYDVIETGYVNPQRVKSKHIDTGEVGYIMASIKQIQDVKIGDTVTDAANCAVESLAGYKEPLSMVFCGLYPVDSDDYPLLRDALEKLKLNDSSLNYEPETSKALGFGFRCGFLGLLHSEVIKERLEREYNVNLIATTPSVIYQVYLSNGDMIMVDNPTNMPDQGRIDRMEEPFIKANILLPADYIGSVMELCNKRRGKMDHMEYLSESRVILHYRLPLSEILIDFFNKLKSLSRGYASFDYEVSDYEASKLVRVDILLNGEAVDAFSFITHKDNAYYRGRELVKKLKEQIPRQMFEIPIQASIGAKVISRENIKALRKNVTAKCYGGDISRKRKLLEKQKEGKKKMKSVGRVEIPEDAFLAILKIEDP
jgi:GTP-binding protein LepA